MAWWPFDPWYGIHKGIQRPLLQENHGEGRLERWPFDALTVFCAWAKFQMFLNCCHSVTSQRHLRQRIREPSASPSMMLRSHQIDAASPRQKPQIPSVEFMFRQMSRRQALAGQRLWQHSLCPRSVCPGRPRPAPRPSLQQLI